MLKIKLFIKETDKDDFFSSYLNEHGAVGVRMGIDGSSGTLAADVARESHAHPAARGLREERPREGRAGPIAGIGPGFGRGRALHARTGAPASPDGRAQDQAHGRILNTTKERAISFRNYKIRTRIRGRGSQYVGERGKGIRVEEGDELGVVGVGSEIRLVLLIGKKEDN